MNARTDLETARRAAPAKGEGDGGPRHFLDISSAVAALCRAALALTAVLVSRHASGIITALTAISEVVTNDGQNPVRR